MNNHIYFGDFDSSLNEQENGAINILPVPYDKTTTWIKGADKGPLAILEASKALELYDIETGTEVYKKGIQTCSFLKVSDDPELMAREVEEMVLLLRATGKFVVTLGGEHSVSIGAVRAHNSSVENMCVLQLDAHADLRDEYEGSKYNHACVTARVKEICPVVQVGIRSMDVEEVSKADPDSIFYARDIMGSADWIEKVIEQTCQNVYVTIDLDVFDPSIMPSTGTPQPGGLDWYQVTKLLKTLSEQRNVVGFDMVELCPNEGNKAPDLLAAKLVYKFLSYIHKN